MPNGVDGNHAGLSALLLEPRHDPRPLLFGPGKLGIIWSAKSACTTVLLWYLWHCDLLQVARLHDAWPHRFRNDVLYTSGTYRAWAAQADADSWRWLRVVRDPFKRAVSSYRHALRHGYEDARMAGVLGFDVTAGYSFAQFLDYLQQIDVSACNLHHRIQAHMIEGLVRPSKVINVDKQDLMACLAELDATLPPPGEPAAALSRAIAEIAPGHHAGESIADGNHAATRFTSVDASGKWPPHRCFIDATTSKQIMKIYAVDFERYGAYF